MSIPKLEREAKGVLLCLYVISCTPLSDDDNISNKKNVHSIANT